MVTGVNGAFLVALVIDLYPHSLFNGINKRGEILAYDIEHNNSPTINTSKFCFIL